MRCRMKCKVDASVQSNALRNSQVRIYTYAQIGGLQYIFQLNP